MSWMSGQKGKSCNWGNTHVEYVSVRLYSIEQVLYGPLIHKISQ